MGDIDLGIDELSDFQVIGRGGFSTIFSAYDRGFNRRVAVKVLHSLDESGLRRFDRERGIMGQLSSHPNVIMPFRAGYTATGAPYLVMELVPGGSLQELIEQRGGLPWNEAVELILPVTAALDHAHEQGILHRDIKPANIVLTGRVSKLTDFGIAAIRESTTTQVAYTLAHCPPEAFATGEDARDERSDLYSMASTLYTLISGRAPYQIDGRDSPHAYMFRIMDHAVPDLPASLVPQPLAAFLRSGLAKDPALRPQSARQFENELRAILAAYGSAVTTGPPARPVRPGSRPAGSPPADSGPPADPAISGPPAAPPPPSDPAISGPPATPPPAGPIGSDPGPAATPPLPSEPAISGPPATPPPAGPIGSDPGPAAPPPPSDPIISGPAPAGPNTSGSDLTVPIALDPGAISSGAISSGPPGPGIAPPGPGIAPPGPAIAEQSSAGQSSPPDPAISGPGVWAPPTVDEAGPSFATATGALPAPSRGRPSPALVGGAVAAVVVLLAAGGLLWRLTRGDGGGPTAAWEFDAGAALVSPPVVSGDTLVIGAGDTNTVHAIATDNGSERWSFTAGGGIGAGPTAADGVVYIGSLDGMFHAIDLLDGSEEWEIDLASEVTSGAHVVDDGLVVVGTGDGAVVGLDRTTGEVRWSEPIGDAVTSTPASVEFESERVVVVGSNDGNVYFLDPATGEKRYTVALEGGVTYSEPLVLDRSDGSGQEIWIGSSQGDVGQLNRIDVDTGRLNTVTLNGAMVTTPALSDQNHIIAGNDAGELVAIDRLTLAQVWSTTLGPDAGITGTPVVHGDEIIVGTGDGRLLAIADLDGGEIWRLAGQEPFGPASPVGEDGQFYVGDDAGTVHRFDLDG